MRVVAEIPHPACRITIFSWNSKYLIKLEKGPLEQTYKVSEMDVTSEEEIMQMIEGDFLEEALKRFEDMENSLFTALGNL